MPPSPARLSRFWQELKRRKVHRTLALEEMPGEEKVSDSRGWKAATYISLVVIVALVFFNVIGPTNTLKAGDIQSLLVLPFENRGSKAKPAPGKAKPATSKEILISLNCQ